MTPDSVLIVDWSAGNDTGPRPRRDAIWLGETGGTPRYLRNRVLAEAALSERIETALTRGQRLLIGFDFPFGYPAGFGRALTGGDDPFALWDWIAARIEDAPRSNNRFDVAGGINRALGAGRGPFWANGLKRDIAGLPRTKADYANPFPDRRACDALAAGAFTCWQLAGAGAVGSQILTGLPVLARLRRRFAPHVAVWPFEAPDRPVVFAEIWPGLIEPAVKAASGDGAIRDAVQVALLARAVAGLAPGTRAAMLDVHAPVEGWIAGLGHEASLIAAATA